MQSSLKLEPNPFEQSFKQGGAAAHPGLPPSGNLQQPGASGQPVEDGKSAGIPGIDKLTTPLPLISGGIPGQPGMGNMTPGSWGFRAGQMTPSFLNTPNGHQNPAKFHQMLRHPALPSPSLMGLPFDPQEAPQPAQGAPPFITGGQSAAANGLYMLSRPPEVVEGRPPAPTTNDGRQQMPLPAGPARDPGPPVALGQHRHSAPTTGEFSHVQEKAEPEGDELAGNTQGEHAGPPRKMRHRSSDDDPESDERRKQFLERNRIAAIKCRRRKKQWVDTLKQRVDYLTQVNEEVVTENKRLRLQLEQMARWVHAQGSQAVPQQIMAVAEVTRGTDTLTGTPPNQPAINASGH